MAEIERRRAVVRPEAARSHRGLDKEDVGASLRRERPKPFGQTGRGRDRRGGTAGLDLRYPPADQILANGRLIQALHEFGDGLAGRGGDLGKHLLRALVASLQTFEVHDGESAEVAQRDGKRHVDHAIHG